MTAMHTTLISTATGPPQQAFIGLIIFYVVAFLICAQIADWYQRLTRKPPPPPFRPPPIKVPPYNENVMFAVAIPDVKQGECFTEVKRLAASATPGWQYRVALLLLNEQMVVLRAKFDRLLAMPPRPTAAQRLSMSHYWDYERVRDAELREAVEKLATKFSQRLANCCESYQLEEIIKAVNQIIQSCQWIYEWGFDQHCYQQDSGYIESRPLRPRIAEHVFRQVELLVGDLRRVLADPQFGGPILFRAEFYIPQKEEVDRPVISVVGGSSGRKIVEMNLNEQRT